MTVQEARKFLEIIATNLLGNSVAEKNEKLRELMLKEYDAINVAIEALEKQIPKKVDDFMERSEEFGSFYKLDFMCPSCNKATICQPYKPKHCKHCGQKIDWGE